MSWYGGKYYRGQYYAGSWYQGIHVPTPTPTPPKPSVGLQEKEGDLGGFLVPPGMSVFGRFSKEVSDPWFGRQNPYSPTEAEAAAIEEMELAELLEILP